MAHFWKWSLAPALVLASCFPAEAQEGKPARDAERRGGISVAAAVPSRWVGVMCVPVDPALRSHLKLTEREGMLVADVAPDGPAGKAGVKKFDVLLAVDGRTIENLGDLLEAVGAADGKEMQFKLIRAGEKVEAAVTPEERKMAEPPRFRRDQGPPQFEEIDPRRIEEFMQRGENHPLRFQMFGPGIVMQGNATLPKGVRVLINKNGEEPAQIHVERGDEKWDVTSETIDKLPEDLRGPIGSMLGGVHAGSETDADPGVTGTFTLAPPSIPQAGAELDALKEQMQRLEQKVDELLKAQSAPADKEPARKPKSKDKV